MRVLCMRVIIYIYILLYMCVFYECEEETMKKKKKKGVSSCVYDRYYAFIVQIRYNISIESRVGILIYRKRLRSLRRKFVILFVSNNHRERFSFVR